MGKSEYKHVDAGNITAHLRPGRHPCKCQARVHDLVRNCLGCGRVVCEQEGSGPCFYCGRLVCTREERNIIEKKDTQSLQLLRKLMNDPALERVDLIKLDTSTSAALSLASLGQNIEAANAYKQKLLTADKDQKVTRANDLQADYFSLEHNPYLTNEEREAIIGRKEVLRQLSLKVKKNFLVDLEVATGSIQRRSQEPIETVNDPIIQSIVFNSVANNIHSANSSTIEERKRDGLMDTFRPKYEEGLSRATVRPADQSKEKQTIRSSRHKIYCIALKQPFANNLLQSAVDEDDRRLCFIPWLQYVEYRGLVLLAALDDADPIEYFNFSSINAEKDDQGLPKRAILGKAQLHECITWDEFNHEYSSYPSFRPLSDAFVLLLTDIETFPAPIPYVFPSEFFEIERSMLNVVNASLVNGDALLNTTFEDVL